MTRGVDLVVVYSPVGGGHKSAALALAETARRRGLAVEIVDAFAHAPRFVGDAYLAAHLAGQRAAPELYGRMYFHANRRDGSLEPLRLEIDNLLFGALADRVRALAPRAVIATHHLPLVVLGRARRRDTLDAPVVGVVTDYIAHACWAERGVDAWAVPYGRAKVELAEHVHENDPALEPLILETGIPVREAFERIAPVIDPRPYERLRVLVTSGGFGVGPLARIVRSFAGVPRVELTVVCGASEKLALRLEEEVAELGLRANVIGFEKDMPSRLADAHVVVGKAGGLTVTETLTAGRPMVIASAVPGNEKLNEALVTNAGAGVASDPDNVGNTVARLRDAGILAAMGARARELVPTGAADSVIDVALSLAATSRAQSAA